MSIKVIGKNYVASELNQKKSFENGVKGEVKKLQKTLTRPPRILNFETLTPAPGLLRNETLTPPK